MVDKVTVTLPGKPESVYPILIGKGLLRDLPKVFDITKYSSLFILTDQNVGRRWLPQLLTTLNVNREIRCHAWEMPAGEENKNISLLGEVWNKFAEAGLDRKSLVINLGGGVVGDLGGFAASTYMRGLDFIQAPTTLLSQVDASVGGKTAIDHAQLKNLVGSFSQPVAVIIDTETLTTLPPRELAAGFAEIIKHGLIQDQGYFDLARSGTASSCSEEKLHSLIAGSCKIKSLIVSCDEKEIGPRKLLNFGHTVGHALESHFLTTRHPLLHGEAISLGMVVEGTLSLKLGLISESEFSIITQALSRIPLPLKAPEKFDGEKMFELMIKDKKNSHGEVRWSLLSGIGRGVYDQSAPRELVLHALEVVQP